MKILLYYHLIKEYEDHYYKFTNQYKDHTFISVNSEEELISEACDAEIIVTGRVSTELLHQSKKLQRVIIPFTGVNSLPFKELREMGVKVTNNHGNAQIVGERAFALSLSLLGKVLPFDRELREGRWSRTEDYDNPFVYWTSLMNKKVTMLGTGSIASYILDFLKPFNCDVMGFRKRKDVVDPPGYKRITTDLNEALSHGEICFVTLPLTSETKRVIGVKELHLLKDSYLINVGRGEVIDEEALYNSLKCGELKGAAIDVWYNYPKPFYAQQQPSKYPFHGLDNIIMSPHAASHTTKGKWGQYIETINNLKALLETGEPLNEVDLVLEY